MMFKYLVCVHVFIQLTTLLIFVVNCLCDNITRSSISSKFLVVRTNHSHKGDSPRNSSRSQLVPVIIGGIEAEINSYPYTAKYGRFCCASIIGSTWALTAAHCRQYTYITVGSKFADGGKRIPIKSIINHPGWSQKPKSHFYDYDFRLLELDETLEFLYANIQPIKIGHRDDVFVGRILTVTGWGYTKQGGKMSPVLRAVEVPIVDLDICQKLPAHAFNGTLTPRMFCAGYKEGEKDACQGDSGGPAVSHGRLIGTVSFGYGCATPDYYGVYSKVAVVRDWITSVTGLFLD